MSISNILATAPGLQADDAEIARYATLLDALGIALLVYAPDAEVCLSNSQARVMLNDGPALFTDESGIVLTEEEQPAALVLRSRCCYPGPRPRRQRCRCAEPLGERQRPADSRRRWKRSPRSPDHVRRQRTPLA
jgi:hypothetical protein